MDMKSAARSQWAWDRGFPPPPPPTVPPLSRKGKAAWGSSPSMLLLYHTGRRRIGGAAKREEAVPTDSQFLQAQGLLTSFVLKYRGPGHSISQW